MIQALQDFAASFPAWSQWLVVALLAAIPFVESYFGSAIGVAIGLPPVIAVVMAVIGNTVSMLVFVYAGASIRERRKRKRPEEQTSAKSERLRRMFDRFGVPGVSLLGQTVLPSQITSGAMVGFGASRNRVIIWQIVSIIMWGAIFAALVTLGLDLAKLR
ncbi:hypothetical protein [Microbacterium sp. YY-01]|uniref:hypothetical protein n=1 Tax=Microbacterium sp. YY-01 TaxID=3421634 RepID=UPI003D17E757